MAGPPCVGMQGPRTLVSGAVCYRDELEDLLTQDHYSADELAELLEVDIQLLQNEAAAGELPAAMIGDRIVDISRAAVVRWLTGPS